MPDTRLEKRSLPLISLKDFPYLARMLENYFDAVPEICVKRPRVITEYHRENNLFGRERISILHKAKAYRRFLETPNPIVRHTYAIGKDLERFDVRDSSPFAGSTTTKFKGVPLYPELIGLMLWPELLTVQNRHPNPFHISKAEAEELNLEIFPCWMHDSMLEIVRRRHYGRNQGPLGKDEVQLLQNLVFFLTSKALCISHTIPDFSKAVYKGLRYMIGEAEEKRTKCTSDSQEEFYHAISEVLQGLITYARNLARGARELARTETDLSLKKNLLEIADIYEWVPEYPARTFREGLTTVWLCWIAVHLENPNVGLSLGRLDQLLHPLYDADITSGRLPKVDDAVELVCYLWLKIGDHVPTMTEMAEQLFGGTGSNQAITVGGVDASGNDAVNDLTYVMLKATELMQLRDPNLNARYHPDKNSKEYLDRLCEVNLKTGATPAIHNDKAVIAALKSKGDKPEWANDYGIVGCVEPVSNGRHYGHSGAILLNLAAALEMTLYNGRHRRVGVGANEPPISFSFPPEVPYPPQNVHDLRKGFELQTQWLIERAVTLNHHFGKAHQDMYPTPILSAFFEGPMDAGKDVVQGGAKINSSGVAIIGLADVADSLSAIEKWVFNAGFISFQELLAALDDNFGNTSLYTRLSTPTKTPIYGNEDTLADWNAKWIVEFLDSTFHKYTNYRGGGYRVGYWTMTTHAAFGKLTQALPNARRAEENFSSGITPCSKRTPVLTTALNSAAGLPANAMSSGVALNIKFTPNDGNGSEMLTKFSDTVEAYCKNGGVEIQFNITDHDRFVKAAHNPDDPEYQKLLVRVSGYTAYFKDLNKNMQKEIIDRTEYLLSKNKMQPHEPFEIED